MPAARAFDFGAQEWDSPICLKSTVELFTLSKIDNGRPTSLPLHTDLNRVSRMVFILLLVATLHAPNAIVQDHLRYPKISH